MLRAIVLLAAGLMVLTVPVSADPIDWINIEYVTQQGMIPSRQSSMLDAQNAIISGAESTAKRGPWSVTNVRDVLPPSKDPHDYLSWAPYHWPDCNWCSQGRIHMAHGPNVTPDAGDGSGDAPPADDLPAESDPYADGGSTNANYVVQLEANSNVACVTSRAALGKERHFHQANHPRHFLVPRPRSAPHDDPQSSPGSVADVIPINGPPPLRTQLPAPISSPTPGPQTSERMVDGTPAPAQAPARTTKGSQSCTPSSTSLAPSATWTRCPYLVRDGRVNPDVRTLNGPSAINGISQSIHYNAIAFALRHSTSHSKNVVNFIKTFFLNPQTKMNPNMEFGQVVRGPGKAGQMGTFTGILDLRGTVKIVNSIMIVKAAQSPEYTEDVDSAMKDWMARYSSWLEESSLGKSTASRPNNHGTFYVAQLTASKILAGDNAGAAAILKKYFTGPQFMDQIAASGEQPFEAVRTRPFHYRCFNLEAMITNVKLGDQIGLNFWSATSKRGATIQTAVDFAMLVDPKSEDVQELVPHVAAVAAAYGDPKGKYAAFLQKTMAGYTAKPFWFYDQPSAFMNSPTAQAKQSARSSIRGREDGPCADHADVARSVPGTSVSPKSRNLPFECPVVFSGSQTEAVELDNGIFVTCDELRPFYELGAVP